MLIISVRHNENKRWKRKWKKGKTIGNIGVRQAIAKVWERNDFVVRLSFVVVLSN